MFVCCFFRSRTAQYVAQTFLHKTDTSAKNLIGQKNWVASNLEMEREIRKKTVGKGIKLKTEVTKFGNRIALLHSINWMTFPECDVFQKAIVMYVNNVCPDHIKTHTTSEIRNRDTRSTEAISFYIPKPNCDLFRLSFVYSGTAIWNSLPPDMKTAASVQNILVCYLKWINR